MEEERNYVIGRKLYPLFESFAQGHPKVFEKYAKANSSGRAAYQIFLDLKLVKNWEYLELKEEPTLELFYLVGKEFQHQVCQERTQMKQTLMQKNLFAISF